ncbi:MAG: hypothetical protein ACFFBS_08505 [Promethearchaeota archaeon]
MRQKNHDIHYLDQDLRRRFDEAENALEKRRRRYEELKRKLEESPGEYESFGIQEMLRD